MRLVLAAVMVVAMFVLAALLVLRFFPYGAGWAGLCVAITCLYASAFGAWVLFGNKPDKDAGAIQSKTARRHILRDNLLYFAVAMAAVTITIAVLINDTEKGIHRSFKNDWFVGFGSARFALGYTAKAFWISETGVSGRSSQHCLPYSPRYNSSPFPQFGYKISARLLGPFSFGFRVPLWRRLRHPLARPRRRPQHRRPAPRRARAESTLFQEVIATRKQKSPPLQRTQGWATRLVPS
jgi:hypothetical protein